MGATVNINITATGTGAAQVISQIQRQLAGLQQQSQQNTRAANEFLDALKSIRNQALAVGVAFKGMVAFGRFIQEGLKFNEVVESATLGIASLISAESKLVTQQGEVLEGSDKLAGSFIHATKQVEALRVAGLKTAATTEQLVDAFQQSVGAGLAAGLSLDNIRKLTIQIVQAAGALGVPLNQLNQEVRSILDATIDRNSRVARVLGITNEEVRANRELGTLFDFLNKKLESFTIASEQAANTWKVVKSNVLEAFQVFAGDITKPFFDQVRNAFKSMLDSLFDFDTARVSQRFAALIEGSQASFGKLGELVAQAIEKGVTGAEVLSHWFEENRTQIGLVLDALTAVARELGGLIVDAIKLAGAVVDWGVKSGAFVATLNTIRDILSIIRDILPVIAAIIGVKIVGAVGEWLIGIVRVQKGFTGLFAVFEAFNALVAANPIGAALLAAGVAAVGLIQLFNQLKAQEEQRLALEEKIRQAQVAQVGNTIALASEWVQAGQAFKDAAENGGDMAKALERISEITDKLIKQDSEFRVALQNQSDAAQRAAAALRSNGIERANLARLIRRDKALLDDENTSEDKKKTIRESLERNTRRMAELERDNAKLTRDQTLAIDDETEATGRLVHALAERASAQEERARLTVLDLQEKINVETARLDSLASVRGTSTVRPEELTTLNSYNAQLVVARRNLANFEESAKIAADEARKFDDALAGSAPKVIPQRGTDTNAAGKAAKFKNDLKQIAEAQIRELQAQLKEQEAALETAVKTQQISQSEFLAGTAAAELATTDKIIAVRAKLSKDLAKFDEGESRQELSKVRDLNAQKVQIQEEFGQEMFKHEQDVQEKLSEMQLQTQTKTVESFDSKKAELMEKYREFLKDLELEGNRKGIDIVINFITKQSITTEIARFKEEIGGLQTDLQTRLSNIQARAESGALQPEQARQQVVFTYQQIIDKIRAAKDEEALFAEAQKDPDLLKALLAVDEILAKLGVDLAQARNQATQLQKDLFGAFTGGLEEALNSNIDSINDFDDAFRAMATSVVTSIRRIVSELIAFQAIKGLFSLFGFNVTGTAGNITGISRKARGGSIQGKGGSREDRVPVMASAGEYMLSADTVKRVGGKKVLDEINFGSERNKSKAVRKLIGKVDLDRLDLRINKRQTTDQSRLVEVHDLSKSLKKTTDKQTDVVRIDERDRSIVKSDIDQSRLVERKDLSTSTKQTNVFSDKDLETITLSEYAQHFRLVNQVVAAREQATETFGKPVKPLSKPLGGFITGPGGPTDDKVPVLAYPGDYVLSAKAVDRLGGPEAVDDINLRKKKPIKRASGGSVDGPGGPRDDRIPIWGSAGEYMLSADTVQRLGGTKVLDEINFGSQSAPPLTKRGVQKMAGGGTVQRRTADSTDGAGFEGVLGLEEGLVLKHLQTRKGTQLLVKLMRNNSGVFRAALSE